MSSFDVDIDLPKSFKPLKLFPSWRRASILTNETLQPHNCGYHPQAIPIDPLTKLASIPYDVAEELGFFKLDFLHLNVYDLFESKEEIDALLELEPDWNLLLIPSVVSKLFQLSKHAELLRQIKPTSIEDVADAIALIRPGSIAILPLYLEDKAKGRKALYKRTGDGFAFKKSHALSYSMVIVLQLHLIELNLL
jgi:DNA polymerase III alpha subunit